MTAGPGRLLKILRVRDGLAVTVGIIIGVGILRTPGLIAGYLGNPWAMLGVWAFGGVVVILSTLVLAEMAAALPQAGGKYVYAREAYGPRVGFVVGWSELLVTRGFSGAAKAVVIAEYLVLLMGRGSVPILAATVVLAFFLLHTGGLRAGRDFQNISTAAKILFILAIGAAGVLGGDGSGFFTGMEVSPEFSGWLGLALAYQAIAFTYYGWEEPAKLAEETLDPGRSLPRILVGGAGAVAILYLLINLAFLSALTPEEMAGSPLVAADALHATFGGAAGTFVTVASLVILLSSLNVQFLGMPRVVLGLAREGMAPPGFTRVSSRGTPQPALVFITVILLGLAVTGAFEFLMRFMMAVAFAVDLVVLAGVFWLRRRMPDLHRPLHVPLYPWLPVITVLLYFIVLATIIATQPGLGLGAATMLGGLGLAGWITLRTPK
ncbi:MAG: amino acid permease [Gemmatimonadota bacterium]|jgi:APA family basic amino acid/polyamine antiporter